MPNYVKTLRQLVGNQCLIVPGVRAIILDDEDRVLLQRRNDFALWGLPGGAVEIGEHALQALKREVAEETALTVIHAEPMALYTGPQQAITYPNGDQIQCFAIAFIVRQWKGTPTPDRVEGSAIRFFPLASLPKDLVPIHQKTLADFAQYTGQFLLPQ